jgi:hypothetical protein
MPDGQVALVPRLQKQPYPELCQTHGACVSLQPRCRREEEYTDFTGTITKHNQDDVGAKNAQAIGQQPE